MQKSDYYKEEAELKTSKVTFMDLGSGLAIASVTILLFLIFTEVKNLMTLKTTGHLPKPQFSFLQTLFGFYFCQAHTGITYFVANVATILHLRTA